LLPDILKTKRDGQPRHHKLLELQTETQQTNLPLSAKVKSPAYKDHNLSGFLIVFFVLKEEAADTFSNILTQQPLGV